MMQLNNKGRTLVEMIAVIVILGIISSVAYPMIFMNERLLDRQIKEAAVRNDIRGLENFLKEDLRNSKEVKTGEDSDSYLYKITLADDTEIVYKKEEREDEVYILREKGNEKIEFTDIEELELEDSHARLIDVKITVLDDKGKELNHELKVARWQWMMKTEEKTDQPGGVVDFIVNENVFVMGSEFYFTGNEVIGDGATLFIKGELAGNDLNPSTKLRVSNIFFDGKTTLKGSSLYGYQNNDTEEKGDLIFSNQLLVTDGWADCGGTTGMYGNIYVAKDLELRGGAICGNLYVKGNLKMPGGGALLNGDEMFIEGNFTVTEGGHRINKDVYVNGDVDINVHKLTFNNNAKIFYYGNRIGPITADAKENNIIKRTDTKKTVPQKEIPQIPVPIAQDSDWYLDKGYSTSTTLQSDGRYFSANGFHANADGKMNIVVVALEGNITLDFGGSGAGSGVLFAPKGKVILNEYSSFTGLIIAKEGLESTSWATLNFQGIETFISDPADYPFINP